jgi:hypothetical protein
MCINIKKIISSLALFIFCGLTAGIDGIFDATTINQQHIKVLGESHNIKSINDFFSLINNPEDYHYLLELPQGTNPQDLMHNYSTLLLARLLIDNSNNATLIDFPQNTNCTNPSAQLTDLLSDGVSIATIHDFLEHLGPSEGIETLPQNIHDRLSQLFQIKEQFEANQEEGIRTLIRFLKTTNIQELSFLLRLTPTGITNREQHFVEEIFNCKHKNILAIVGINHLQNLHQLLELNNRIIELDHIKSMHK